MDPEDKIDITDLLSENITWSGGSNDSYDATPEYVYNSKLTWNVTFANVSNVASNDNTVDIMFDDFSDTSFDVKPMENEPAVYTSHEQREQHEKYPALQKIWEDYLAMFALTKGEPPIVD